MKRWMCVLVVVLLGCTSATEATSTTATTRPFPSTTSTVAGRCPDVFCVVFRIDPQAKWSDGTPVTSADFEHTVEQARGEAAPAYALVTGVETTATDEVTVAFSEVTARFFELFRPVLPAHDPAVTSGGFEFDGSRLVSSRVAVELVSVEGVRGAITALARGEVDKIWLVDPPSWAVEDLAGVDGVTTSVGEGRDWEMVTFNQADPLLSIDWVRRAIVMALDREAMADATVRTVDPEATVLNTTLAGFETEPYPIRHDPVGARSLLEGNGCTPGSDGILDCQGVRMAFDWVTTAGDPWRLAMAEMAADSLAEIGIQLSVSPMLPSDLFAAEHLFGEEWDMAAFSWEAQLDPVAAADLYRCRGDGPHGHGALNVGRHCGDDEILDAAEASLDPDERMALMRQADRELLAGGATVPFFSRPVLAAWAEGVAGVEPGPFADPLDRVAEWTGEARLAVTSPPTDLLRVLHRNAFRALPGGEYLPDLVIEYETIGS